MVEFDPKFTEVIYFDLEFYVPPECRQLSKCSMKYNPGRANDLVLGGVFCREFPLLKKGIEQPKQFWIWNEGQDEKATLRQIYYYFRESWDLIERKTDRNPELILVGIGISRSDIPALYVRSVFHDVAGEEELYETYCKTRIVDLSDVGILLFGHNPKIYPLYPKAKNDLAPMFGLQPDEKSKGVWKLYEDRQYDTIQKRTTKEVEDVIKISSGIISKIALGQNLGLAE